MRKGEKKEEKIRAHIFISGRVQGVFFRESIKKKAGKLGVSGWVKNLKNGSVEVVFEGDRGNVEKIIKWAKRGPILAKVDGFNLSWEKYQGIEFSSSGFSSVGQESKDFEIRYDL